MAILGPGSQRPSLSPGLEDRRLGETRSSVKRQTLMFKMTITPIAGVMFAAVGAIITATPQAPADRDRAAVLQDFQDRIGEYTVLHRRLEGSLPPPTEASSPTSFILNRTHLASAIKTARPNARQGDVFTPAVVRLFRDVIRNALAGQDAEAMLRDLFWEHPRAYAFHPRVYDRYPDWATHEMPAILLQNLHPLPEGLEYRVVNHDLVLLDIHADLIIDVLSNAIPRSAT